MSSEGDSRAVRVRIESESVPQTVHGEESTEQVHVQRVPRNEVVAASRSPWTEGDTLGVPVYAERVELRRTLVLTEELRITRQARRQTVATAAPVRREHAVVERRQPDGGWREIEVASAGVGTEGNLNRSERNEP